MSTSASNLATNYHFQIGDAVQTVGLKRNEPATIRGFQMLGNDVSVLIEFAGAEQMFVTPDSIDHLTGYSDIDQLLFESELATH